MTQYAMAVDLRSCAGCAACVVACQMQNGQRPGVSWNKLDLCEWGEEVGESGRAYVPHACMQCDEPPCVDVCPVAATSRGEDGVTTIDYDKCIGCGACVEACPYDARTLVGDLGNMFGAEEPAPYESYEDRPINVAQKCDYCSGRRADGKLPACVVNCPGGARHFGDLDDPESDVSKFLAANPDAVRIDVTSQYYVPFEGMPDEGLPFAASLAKED